MEEILTDGWHIKVGDLNQAAIFFRDVLGWAIESLDAKTHMVNVSSCNGVSVFLSEEPNDRQTNHIYLNTTDCIEQYCLLKAKGLVFIKAPSYQPGGLMAEFADEYGNHYFLFEPRNYDD